MLAGIGTVVLSAIGAVGVVTAGLAWRYPAQDRSLATLDFRVAGDYVARRFDAAQNRDFNPVDTRRKVLLIGDSFAKDILNAVAESSMNQRMQFSTRHIVHLCGNLFIPRPEFESHLATAPHGLCASNALFEDQALRRRMAEADEIWFAAAWQSWQAPLVAESLRRTRAFAEKPVRIYTRKNFGTFKIREILEVPAAKRADLRRPVLPEVLQVNQVLRQSIAATELIDVQALMCGPDTDRCGLMTPAGDLVSHDGGHL